MHPSFAKKPLSVMQLHNQLSHLEVHEKHFATVDDLVPAPVKATQDSIYDPTHPDADWAGLVHRTAGTRKHERDHKSQAIGIVHTEDGIVSKDAKAEFQRKRRDLTTQSEDTSYILGGVLDRGHKQYMTDMQRGNAGVRTDAEQIVLARRSLYKHDTPAARPAANSGGPVGHENRRNYSESTVRNQHAQSEPQQPASNCAPKGQKGSLLSGLADSLVHNESLEFPGSRSQQVASVSNPRSIYNK